LQVLLGLFFLFFFCYYLSSQNPFIEVVFRILIFELYHKVINVTLQAYIIVATLTTIVVAMFAPYCIVTDIAFKII